jgi:chromosome segregation ATPase
MKLALAAVSAVALILGALYLRTQSEKRGLARQNAEFQAAAARADHLRAEAEKERDTLRAAHEALGHPEPEATAPRPDASPADATARLDLIRTLGDTQQKLAAANASLDDLHRAAANFEARVAELTRETVRLGRTEAELKDRLDTQSRLVAALQVENRTRADRLLELETTLARLRQRKDDSANRLAPVLQASAEIEELSRRREVHLTSILRRYREVTDLYRNLTLRAESPSGDISRVQNAISLADEEMKQIESINAQTAQLQRKLAAASQDALKP